jgi:hypothetical protein
VDAAHGSYQTSLEVAVVGVGALQMKGQKAIEEAAASAA